MNIREYQDAVIDLFKSGKATNEQWEEMSASVLYVSESSRTPEIDAVIVDQEEDDA